VASRERIRFVDGHNDVLLALHKQGAGAAAFLERREDGHLDLVRAREGGFQAGFFAIFVPPEDEPSDWKPPVREPPYVAPLAEPIGYEWARREADALIDLLLEIEATSAGEIAVVRSAADLEGPTLGAIVHFEGAEPIDPELETLEELYDRGLRSLGLVWSRPNAFAEGVSFRFPGSPDTGPGLTEAGRRLVRACHRLGILVDLSHLNEHGFWDVARLSDAPLVASHSNAHALCAVSRNLTDDQLDEIGRSDGIVGITFHAGMLREDGRVDATTPLSRIVDHVEYVVGRIGVDHVGFGSDFDGAIVIEELGDAAGLPGLVEALRERGYADAEIAKLTHRNWLRVLRETWRVK
jgi:membrane dipeptidase